MMRVILVKVKDCGEYNTMMALEFGNTGFLVPKDEMSLVRYVDDAIMILDRISDPDGTHCLNPMGIDTFMGILLYLFQEVGYNGLYNNGAKGIHKEKIAKELLKKMES